MIPRVLQIKNFLSYSAKVQEIDFKPYSLVCLSGKNGHGKSALLDAITWSLWGQARKSQGTGKPDEGLLRMGQSRLFVSFEFEVGDDIFRVSREFFKGHGRPVSSLEFQIKDKATGEFSSLTDKTIRATQEKIEKCVGLDYETFLNTSFFRQGSSNEFSKKTPKERKQILSRIIGLEKYDLMSAKAQEQARMVQDKLSGVMALQEGARQEVKLLPELKEKFNQTKLQVEKSNKELEGGQKKILDLAEKIKNLDAVLAVKDELEAKQKAFVGVCRDWRLAHKQISGTPKLEPLEAEKKELKSQEEKFVASQKTHLELAHKNLALENQINERRQLLTREFEGKKEASRLVIEKHKLEAQGFEREILQLEGLKRELSVKVQAITESRQKKNQELGSTLKLKNSVEILQARYSRLLEYKEFCSQKIRVCRDEVFESQARLKSLESSSQALCCPTCGQGVSQDVCHQMSQDFLSRKTFFSSHGRRVKTALELCNKQIVSLQTHLGQVSDKLLTSQAMEAEVAGFDRQLKEFEAQGAKVEGDLVGKAKHIAEHKAVLRKLGDDFKSSFELPEKLNSIILADPEAAMLKKTLDEQKIKEKELGAFQAELEAVRSKLGKVEEKIVGALKADSERRVQVMRRSAIDEQYRQIKKTLSQFGGHFEKAAHEKSNLEEQKIKLEIEFKQVRAKAQEALQELGSCRQELTRVEALEKSLTAKEAEVASLKQEEDEYSLLAGAFGKNGIQALIIESVIPEIEAEANKIIGQLTGDQTKIFIEPLKDLKKGGYKESLDIKISDSAGTRPYEMFSGGEAFRIDFALRISISKLLARRAGARLQTLIIDEGFGSQDQEGIARLLEAINLIRTDFSKVIVVSHLQELKDDFPVHFLVTKHPTGSTVTVEYRG